MPDEVSPPSRRLLAMEPMGVLEIPALLASSPFLATARRGPRHRVLVLPGFAADDASTALIRGYLGYLGYEVHGWGLGRNNRRPGADLPSLTELIRRFRQESGKPVSLIGWSRGGLMARELARADPEAIRMVITLGSPFAAPMANNVSVLSPRATGADFTPPPGSRVAWDPRPIPVPATSIYTKNDGVVGWQACLDQVSDKAENVEVRTTHIGLGFHPPALWVLADRLAQPMGEWKPFQPPPLLRPFFPRPEAG